MIAPDIDAQPGYAGRLDPRQLLPGHRHYNHAVCWFRGDLLCAYRVQDAQGLSRVGLATLKEVQGGFEALAHDRLLVLPLHADEHAEDPRLIVIRGVVHLFVATVRYGASYHFRFRGFRLDTATLGVRDEIPLEYGHNGVHGKTEKNWMPFETDEGGLGFIYAVEPFTVIDHDQRKTVAGRGGLRKWRWGSINGRTNAVRLEDGSWLCLVGGHIPHHRRTSLYWAAALRFARDENGNYVVTGISKRPILWGSSETPAILNPMDANWNPLCVFPAGLVFDPARANVLLCSLGVNDSYCDFLRFDIVDLLQGLVAPKDVADDAVLTAQVDEVCLDGMVRVKVKSVAPVGEPGGPFKRGQEFITSRDRVQALGDLVEVVP